MSARSLPAAALIGASLVLITFCSPSTAADAPAAAKEGKVPFKLLATHHGTDHLDAAKVETLVRENLSLDGYRRVSAQVIHDENKTTSHILVRRHAKDTGHAKLSMIDVDADLTVSGVKEDYALTDLDHSNQPHTHALAHSTKLKCPDDSIQILVLAPLEADNKRWFSFEKEIAQRVANAAKKKGYVVKELYGTDATALAAMNAMSSPNLIGIFYDGDSNRYEVEFHDSFITAADITTHFKGKLSKVSSIWLACEAFNDPMKKAMTTTAGSKVYAAGISILYGGDERAASAMIAALEGKPMKESFDNSRPINPKNKWGWYSGGSDFFGK